jgi:sugar/nucleoside kinase (ribokinase family)
MRHIYEHDGRELRVLFEAARARGARTSLDMSLPDPESPGAQIDWRRWLTNVLPYVDYFVPSIDELRFMLGKIQAKQAC